jgi:hypothetical protein
MKGFTGKLSPGKPFMEGLPFFSFSRGEGIGKNFLVKVKKYLQGIK